MFLQKALLVCHILACSILPNTFPLTKPRARQAVPAAAMYMPDPGSAFVDMQWREILTPYNLLNIRCCAVFLNHVRVLWVNVRNGKTSDVE